MTDQATTLRQLHQQKKKAKTVAIVSGKGGVGKSTTVVNMAIELRKSHHKVLLFDLDVGMGNIDLLIGQTSAYSIIDYLKHGIPIQKCIETGPLGMDYITAGSSLSAVFQIDGKDFDRFFKAYGFLTSIYDYIFFDLGAGATKSNLPFALAADECIVVTTPEPTAITDAYSMIKLIVKEQEKLPISVIMNRSQGKQAGEEALVRFIQVVAQFLNVKVTALGTLPNDHFVSTAVMRQIPYTILNEHAVISKKLRQIVTDYTNQGHLESGTGSITFIQKLSRFLRR